MNIRFINYFSKQKMWYCNLYGIVHNYKHRGEENDLYLVHMCLPKLDLDRIGYYPKNWRWKSHGIEREW